MLQYKLMRLIERSVATVTNYEEAHKHYNASATIRGSDLRQGTLNKRPTARLKKYPDGSIGYRHFGHEFIVYHPDGDITVHADKQQRQGEFPRRSVPDDIFLDLGTRIGPICIMGGRWWDPKATIVQAGEPVRLRRNDDHDWWPVDEASLQPFEWKAIDQKKSRPIAAAAGLPAFESWYRALKALTDDELPPYRKGVDVVAALKEERFMDVLEGLPRARQYKWGPTTGGYYVERLAGSFLKNLRNELYAAGGALVDKSARILTRREFKTVEGLLKRFERIGDTI